MAQSLTVFAAMVGLLVASPVRVEAGERRSAVAIESISASPIQQNGYELAEVDRRISLIEKRASDRRARASARLRLLYELSRGGPLRLVVDDASADDILKRSLTVRWIAQRQADERRRTESELARLRSERKWLSGERHWLDKADRPVAAPLSPTKVDSKTASEVNR